MGNKPVSSSAPPWSLHRPCLQLLLGFEFLPWFPSLNCDSGRPCEPNKLFFSKKKMLVITFYHSTSKLQDMQQIIFLFFFLFSPKGAPFPIKTTFNSFCLSTILGLSDSTFRRPETLITTKAKQQQNSYTQKNIPNTYSHSFHPQLEWLPKVLRETEFRGDYLPKSSSVFPGWPIFFAALHWECCQSLSVQQGEEHLHNAAEVLCNRKTTAPLVWNADILNPRKCHVSIPFPACVIFSIYAVNNTKL